MPLEEAVLDREEPGEDVRSQPMPEPGLQPMEQVLVCIGEKRPHEDEGEDQGGDDGNPSLRGDVREQLRQRVDQPPSRVRWQTLAAQTLQERDEEADTDPLGERREHSHHEQRGDRPAIPARQPQQDPRDARRRVRRGHGRPDREARGMLPVASPRTRGQRARGEVRT
jgi:hypothetical protein